MPVGKGSIARAVKSQNKEVEAVVTEKKAAPKKTAAKKPAVKKETNIHEEKFQVVSHIQCELPVHLL